MNYQYPVHRDPNVKVRTPQLTRDKSVVRQEIMEDVETLPDRLVVPLLIAKLHSEVEEVALDLRNPEEYGDVLESLVALAKKNGITWHEIVQSAAEKAERKGGLNDGVFWIPEQFMESDNGSEAAA